MRLSVFTVGIFACFVAIVAAWSKEDQEIFRLRDEVELSEGVGVSFYDFVGTTPGANQDEINKAYRKRSKVLHPDKVKREFAAASKSTGKGKTKGKRPAATEIDAKAKEASDRFARLGIVTNILRGPGRERYDHFLSNGFPKWKGTGYYYERFRPGLLSVLVLLFAFVGGFVHWILLYFTWTREQELVTRYVTNARRAAWGDSLNIPGIETAAAPAPTAGGDDSDAMQPINRKQRRWQEQQAKKDKSEKKPKGMKATKASPAATPASGSTGARKRVTAENGKVLIVDSIGNVFLEQANEDGEMQEFLLDPNEMARPTYRETALVRLPLWAFNSVVSRFNPKKPTSEDDEDSVDEEIDTPGTSSSGAEDFEVLEKVKTSAQNGSNKAVRRKKSSTRGR